MLEKACELVQAAGAKNAKMLNVSGAFHTPYMESAQAALSKTLDESDIQMPSIQVYSNVTGKPYTSVDEIKTLLKRQLLEPVKWEQGTKDLITGGHAQCAPPSPRAHLPLIDAPARLRSAAFSHPSSPRQSAPRPSAPPPSASRPSASPPSAPPPSSLPLRSPHSSVPLSVNLAPPCSMLSRLAALCPTDPATNPQVRRARSR